MKLYQVEVPIVGTEIINVRAKNKKDALHKVINPETDLENICHSEHFDYKWSRATVYEVKES